MGVYEPLNTTPEQYDRFRTLKGSGDTILSNDRKNAMKWKSWYGSKFGETATYWHGSSYMSSGFDPTKASVMRPGEGEIYCAEANDSPSSVSRSKTKTGSVTRKCIIVGTYNYNVAEETLQGWLDLNNLRTDFPDPGKKGVPLDSYELTIDSEGAPKWTATLNYTDSTNKGNLNYEIQISCATDTVHLTTSLETIQSISCIAGTPPTDYYGLIGLDAQNEPEGVDVKRNTFSIQITERKPFKKVNPKYLTNLMNYNPSVNSVRYCGFSPGTILYEGTDVDLVNETDENDSEVRWKLTHKFSGAANMSGQTEKITDWYGYPTGEVTPPFSKNAWDYLWRRYVKTVADGRETKLLEQVNVERVYVYADFVKTLGLPEFQFEADEDYLLTDANKDNLTP